MATIKTVKRMALGALLMALAIIMALIGGVLLYVSILSLLAGFVMLIAGLLSRDGEEYKGTKRLLCAVGILLLGILLMLSRVSITVIDDGAFLFYSSWACVLFGAVLGLIGAFTKPK